MSVITLPEAIEGTWEEISRQVARLNGHRLRVTILPDEVPPSTSYNANDATLALFAQWAKDDANATDEERAEDERVYSEIEKNGIPRTQI